MVENNAKLQENTQKDNLSDDHEDMENKLSLEEKEKPKANGKECVIKVNDDFEDVNVDENGNIMTHPTQLEVEGKGGIFCGYKASQIKWRNVFWLILIHILAV